MIHRALLFILFSTVCPFLYAQELKNFDFYYSHPQVSQEAKEYYAGLYSVNNSEKAYTVMDSAFTQNDETRPFYIYLVCRMLGEADENMMSEISIICHYVAEIHPTTLMAVLHAGPNFVPDKYKEIWANRISTEIRVTCERDLMECYKLSRTNIKIEILDVITQTIRPLYSRQRACQCSSMLVYCCRG